MAFVTGHPTAKDTLGKTSQPIVCTKYVYNSALHKKHWESLFARGRKTSASAFQTMAIYKNDTGSPGNIRYEKPKLGKGVHRKTYYKKFANKTNAVLDSKVTLFVDQNRSGDKGGYSMGPTNAGNGHIDTKSETTKTTGNNEVSHLINSNAAPIYDIHWLTDNDKFNNALHRNRCELKKYRGTCDLFDEYKNQSDFQFGFIPLSDFMLPESEDKKNQSITCPLKQHFIVRASGAPNFLKCRIPIATQLNIPAWEWLIKKC